MGMPAARVGDNHICPMMDGPKPHVGGLIMPPGKPTVLISGLPASTVGNLCVCISPAPDIIIMGSVTVLISGMPAARLSDKTAHGGIIVFGAGTVLIGDFAAVGAVKVFPGRQRYGNCGVQSSQQIIHQATGENPDENTILNVALAGGHATNSAKKHARGGSSAKQRQALLKEYGVASTVIKNPTKADLADALKNNKGIVANVDAGTLWNNRNYDGGGHAITITEGDFDEHGELTHVYINDTGTGKQGQRLSADEMMRAMTARTNSKGNSSYQINVTEAPVWTQLR